MNEEIRAEGEDLMAQLEGYGEPLDHAVIGFINRLTARCEAMERAQREECVCSTCLYVHNDVDLEPCHSYCDSNSAWQFDEKRFAGGERE